MKRHQSTPVLRSVLCSSSHFPYSTSYRATLYYVSAQFCTQSTDALRPVRQPVAGAYVSNRELNSPYTALAAVRVFFLFSVAGPLNISGFLFIADLTVLSQRKLTSSNNYFDIVDLSSRLKVTVSSSLTFTRPMEANVSTQCLKEAWSFFSGD